MSHIIIGTAGHVDHGKTQLIRALTGVDTDRLKEEKKRGITIDLGFAWLDLPDGGRAGIIDVPGHERFVKNMLAGAGGVTLAMLVIAADDGVMPQTREHLAILNLLDIRDGVIVITKADLADADWIAFVQEDIRAATKDTFLQNAPMVVVSSYTGQGIEELRAILIQRVQKATGGNESRPFRVPVDRIFSSPGFGTIITGTLIEGTLSEGDEVEIFPARLRSRVRNLQVHSKDVETASAGQRVAVNLAGIKRDDLQRGDVLAVPGSMKNTFFLDVKLSALKDSGRILKNGSRLHFYQGSREALCKLILLGCDTLKPGQAAYAQLRFTEPIAVKKGDRFIVRFYSPVETVGGGVILDANPKRHQRSDSAIHAALRIRETGSDKDALLQAISDASPGFTPLQDIQKQLSMDNEKFRTLLETLLAEGSAVRLSTKTAVSTEYIDALGRKLHKLLRDYHAANPLQAGMRRDELRGRLLPKREISLVDRILSYFEQNRLIIAVGPKLALSDFQIVYTEDEKKVSERIVSALRENEYAPPSLEELFAMFPREKMIVKRVFDALLDSGVLVMTSGQVFFLSESVEKAWQALAQFIATHGQITLAAFRDIIGTSRKYALPLLEYYDKEGRTRMIGDARFLGPNARHTAKG